MAGKKEYKMQNDEFLRNIALQDGVMPLNKGIYYEVLQTGDGQKPKMNNIVSVYYKGSLINGKVFDDNTAQGYPEAMRLTELITGWQIVLTQMCVGDKWRVYIPAELGYGSRGTDGIPRNSTLIFEIHLVSIA